MNLKSMSDEVLVAKYVEGQNEAFDVLVDRYKDRVFAQIMKTVKDPDVADDIFTAVKAGFGQ